MDSGDYNLKDLLVGTLLVLVIGYLIYVALGLGNWRIVERTGYLLYSDFLSVSGLEVGAPVQIAGVTVGEVESIDLGPDYQARVALRMQEHVTVEEDAVAVITGEGILGSQSVTIIPGQSHRVLEPGEEIVKSESAVSLQDIIGEFIAGDLISGN
jgi:phospholipid/cholesterol/gamma-HCH transport system substrate-binding protein